jgi:DNA-binding CsgD family transcriptional regulator
MHLLERGSYLDDLAAHYHQVEKGSGHTIFLIGEAGIGKTSLVNHFAQTIESTADIYSGACDSLFTPRPLGPLLDIADQIGQDFSELLRSEKDRSLIFAALIQKLASMERPVVMIFEDIHWADEATIDLIKFLARRIHRYKCLFLLTYRDGEIHAGHPLANIFGELPSDNFSKVAIQGFSREVVDHLTAEKGYTSGEQVYALTGGNPFYVLEILASYSPGIPERVKDSILTVFHTRPSETKALWEFLSILRTSRIDLSIAKRIESDFAHCIDSCIASGVIVSRPGYLSFKHELFRLAIEESLAPSRRKTLHRKMLDLMLEVPADSRDIAQLVHHARYADDRDLVAKIAPEAARDAAAVGAHIEASKLYLTAIEYTDKQDPVLAELYERHAYECYLTYQIKQAIASQEHALRIWQDRKVRLKEGDALRFLSGLWSFEGNPEKAIALAQQAIEVLENGFPTRERAMAYSNFSQICMFGNQQENALHWSNKAIELASNMEDNEILSHALNNLGTVLLQIPAFEKQGEENLNRSLALALEHGFHEHVARGYASLASSFVLLRRYDKAMAVIDAGEKYCEERDLDSWKNYIVSCMAQLLLETGRWDEAEGIAKRLENDPNHHVRIRSCITLARIDIRRGQFDNGARLIAKAKEIAIPTKEGHRIIPVMVTELERCWISGEPAPLDEVRTAESTLLSDKNGSYHYSEFVYWMLKCGLIEKENIDVEMPMPFKLEYQGDWQAAAELWKEIGCPYEQALSLIDGDEEHQRMGLQILDGLGATATSQMLKRKLKMKGLRNIPRGLRTSTLNNPAQLTRRQIEILILLQGGSQNKEIANKLFISPKTVDHHISAILSKLEVNTRAKAVLEAHKLGILK